MTTADPSIEIPDPGYPLVWPAGKAITREPQRSKFGRFGKGNLSVYEEASGVLHNLKLMGAQHSVVSSNLPTRSIDGMPRSDVAVAKNRSKGVAVYWLLDDTPHVMACDTFDRVEDNLHAIALTLEAMRGIERWGAVQAAQMFQGFQALPPGTGEVDSAQRPWREVFAADGGPIPTDLPPEDQLAIAKGRYRRAIAKAHPDAGGDMAAAAELNQAMADAEAELTAAVAS
jgi:hypothetical protein